MITHGIKVGDVFDKRFRIVKFCNKGSSGSVWHAKHVKTDEDYALKCIDKPDEDELNRLLQEIHKHTSLPAHDNILPCSGAFADHGYLVLVLPLADMSLHDAIIANLSIKNPLHVLHRIADALHYLHKNDVWHGDIKAENVLLFTMGEKEIYIPKLADFGVQRTTATYAVTSNFPADDAPMFQKTAWDAFAFGVLGFVLLTGGKLPQTLQNKQQLCDWQGMQAVDWQVLRLAAKQHHLSNLETQQMADLLNCDDEVRIKALTMLAYAEQNEHTAPVSSIVIAAAPNQNNTTKQKTQTTETHVFNDIVHSCKKHKLLALFGIGIGALSSFYLIAHTFAYFGNTMLMALIISTCGGLLMYCANVLYYRWKDRDHIRDDFVLFVGVGIFISLMLQVPIIMNKDYKKELCQAFYGPSWINPSGRYWVSKTCELQPNDLYDFLNTAQNFSVKLRTSDQRNIYYEGEMIPFEIKRSGKMDTWILLDYIIPSADGKSFNVWHQKELLNSQTSKFTAPINLEYGPEKWTVLLSVGDTKWPKEVQNSIHDGQESLTLYTARLMKLKQAGQLPISNIALLENMRSKPALKSKPNVVKPVSPDFSTTKITAQFMQKALPNSVGAELTLKSYEASSNDRPIIVIDVQQYQGIQNKPYIMVDYVFESEQAVVVEHQTTLFNKQTLKFGLPAADNRPNT
ncbi:MAG: protein kinase family protein, partial [Mariprofundales bacterium]